MKSLAMHITNQKLRFYIFTVEIYKISLCNDFLHQIFFFFHSDPYNVMLAIATNTPVLLMTALCSRLTYLRFI